jgi:hypothetical protein
MRYFFTVRIPSRNGVQVQQIEAEHPASTIGELAQELNTKDFIVVNEMWADRTTGESTDNGPIILSCRAMLKVRGVAGEPRTSPGRPLMSAGEVIASALAPSFVAGARQHAAARPRAARIVR